MAGFMSAKRRFFASPFEVMDDKMRPLTYRSDQLFSKSSLHMTCSMPPACIFAGWCLDCDSLAFLNREIVNRDFNAGKGWLVCITLHGCRAGSE